MRVLSELEPKNVFSFFEDICNIPHPSYKEDKISNYLVDFAKERKLEYYQDALNNVIIIKEASKGYEYLEDYTVTCFIIYWYHRSCTKSKNFIE